MNLRVLVLPVFIVCYGIAKCIREITREVLCRYLMTNEYNQDRMKCLYNTSISSQVPRSLGWSDLHSGWQASWALHRRYGRSQFHWCSVVAQWCMCAGWFCCCCCSSTMQIRPTQTVMDLRGDTSCLSKKRGLNIPKHK